jgi:hypothetical protein
MNGWPYWVKERFGFTARALSHSIVTNADTWEQLRVNVCEAVLSHFEEGKAPAIINRFGCRRKP